MQFPFIPAKCSLNNFLRGQTSKNRLRSILLLIILIYSYTGGVSHFSITQGVQSHDKSSINVKNPQERKSNLSLHSMEEPLQYTPVLNKTGDAFEGYNLFSLIQQDRADINIQNRSLLATNMKGELLRKQNGISFPQGAWVIHSAKFINSTTILFGEQDSAVLWNIYNEKKVNLGFLGHHDLEYNPNNNTVFTFDAYSVKIDGAPYRFDIIAEYTLTGQLIWSFDTRSFLSHTQWCPFQDLFGGDRDIAHSNSIFFDAEEDILYFNARNLNTFYKISHRTGQVLWGLGEYGDFTLFDQSGNKRDKLFYHAHSLEQTDDNTFILFDNDYHNQTNPYNQRSRLLEITINETTMTAYESWVWSAPPAYYSAAYGDADRLPNGNRLGVFGTPWHLYETHTEPLGAVLIEVDNSGQIVWEMYFPNTAKYQYSVYRLERFRLSPILSNPPDIRALSTELITISWQTWYNFRINRRMEGNFTLFLDGVPFKTGIHTFDKFWRPTNLKITLKDLSAGNHNLSLAISDEAGHMTTDSLNLSITEFYLEREGPLTVEHGQETALLQWKGNTSHPLFVTLSINNTQESAIMWNGSNISLDLNLMEVGTYAIALQVVDQTKLIHDEQFLVKIYPSAAPIVHAFPLDRSIIWNESYRLSWVISDNSPTSWSIFVNNSLSNTGSGETPTYQLTWSVPVLDEGVYNITLAVHDSVNYQQTLTRWLTVKPPSSPIIIKDSNYDELQWGLKNTSLHWEVHGGAHWILWKNGTMAYTGEITGTQIEIQIKNWEREKWDPGLYNVTLQIRDNNSVTIQTSWIRVWVNQGDSYADSIVSGMSMWYRDGKNALGEPDNQFTQLFFDYGNGHITLDMGSGEEILDGRGVDFTVYARGGEYIVFGSSNLSSTAILAGNQVTAPLVMLGEGYHNASFDLASVNMTQVRYLQIVYSGGETVELDAVAAINFNHPPRPISQFERWRFLIGGIILAVSVILGVWVRKKKRQARTS